MIHRLRRPGLRLHRRKLLVGLLCAASTLTLACGSSPPPQTHANLTPVEPSERAHVLFVLTSANEQVLANGKRRNTGYFLSEFYEPLAVLQQLGHEIHIATPDGEPPVVDPEGMEDAYWHDVSVRDQALAFVKKDPRVAKPLSLDEALRRAGEWDGLVIPGGQGVMVDLYPNERVRQLIITLGEAQKAVGLICHSPALLAKLGEENPFAGRAVTAISPFEEFYIETFVMGGKAQTRKIGRSLRQAGLDYDSALPKANHAVRDCNLVTSQNPFSGDAFVEKFLPALHDAKQGRPCGPG